MSDDFKPVTYKISKFSAPPDANFAKVSEQIRQEIYKAFQLGIEQALVDGEPTAKTAWKDARKNFFLPAPAAPEKLRYNYNLPCYLPSPFEKFKNNLLKWIKENGADTETMERMSIAIHSSIFTREWKDVPISTWKELELTSQYLFGIYKRIMNGDS